MRYLRYVNKAVAGGTAAAVTTLATVAGGGITRDELLEVVGAFVVGAVAVFFAPKNGPKPVK